MVVAGWLFDCFGFRAYRSPITLRTSFRGDMRGVSKHIVLVVGGVVAVGAVIAAVIAVGIFGSGGHQVAARTGAGVSVSANQGMQVAAALRTLATNPQDVVADEARPRLGGHVSQAVPPGSRVSPDVASWAPDGIGGGTMLVTVSSPGQAPVRYAAVMVFEHHSWKVLATFPVMAHR